MRDVIQSEVIRKCEGNRFCNFTGPLYSERMLFVTTEAPSVVGACWAESLEYPDEPKRFVCNRCAHKVLRFDAGTGPEGRVWMLCCPYDGEPLGKGNNWLIVNQGGIERYTHVPGPAELASRFPPSEDVCADGETSYDLLKRAITYFRKGDSAQALLLCERACEKDPENRTARIMRYRCLQNLGDFGVAQQSLESFTNELSQRSLR